MLLFVKQRFVDQIRAGTKTFELRAGSRYSKIRPGDSLSINGRFRVTVERVETYPTLDSLLGRDLLPESDIRECYPDASGPFYVFHFSPPPAGVAHP